MDAYKDLESLELKGLERKLACEILMEWLREQIKQDRIPQEKETLREFANVLRKTCRPVTMEEINQRFNQWQELDATNRRRYFMAQTEVIDALWSLSGFANPTKALQDAAASCKAGDDLDDMAKIDAKDRKYLFQVCKRQKSGANTIPLGRNRMSTAAAAEEAVEVPDDSSRPEDLSDRAKLPEAAFESNGWNNPWEISSDPYPEKEKPSQLYVPSEPRPKVSSKWPTNLKRSDSDDMILLDSPSPSKMSKTSKQGRGSGLSFEAHLGNEGKKNPAPEGTRKKPSLDLSMPPPSTYKCKRCAKGGHWVQACPTNLDLSMGKRRARSYRCDIRKRFGGHHSAVCPDSLKFFSVTQRRRRHNMWQSSSRREVPGEKESESGSSNTTIEPGVADPYRPRRSPSPIRRSTKQNQLKQKRSKNERYGLFGYDDDDFMSSDDGYYSRQQDIVLMSKAEAKAEAKAEPSKTTSNGDIQMKDAPSPAHGENRDTESGQEVSQFLSSLLEDIRRAKRLERFEGGTGTATKEADPTQSSSSLSSGSLNIPVEADVSTSVDDDHDKPEQGDSSILQKPDGVLLRLVQEPVFSPEIVALFKGKENPIVHSKPSRPSALDVSGDVSQPGN
ncbi:hypothetical protein F4780DRAFT_194740 [Xylariomycetidae sp. FL0641]|nr:hypothetical protein F4780DRAFT_194740 [Xylariomycetidae sp. FL0641]